MASYSGTVTEAMIPHEVRNPFPPGITVEQLKIRLREGGTIRFNSAIHELSGGGYDTNSYTFWACDTLEIKKSKFITNGNTLVIFCNRLVADDADLIAFEAAKKKAPNGKNGSGASAHGEPGVPGDSAGLVSIHVIDEFVGRLRVNLSGQDGGNGGIGSDGGRGHKGSRGSASKSGFDIGGFPPHPQWRCKREAGKGGTGGAGGPGGVGGSAGNGGAGGIFQLFNVDDEPIPSASYEFIGNAGVAGSPGEGGLGGPGGDGGDGGEGSTMCHGGPHGDTGSRGSNGKVGEHGVDGAPGQIIAENLDLEIIIQNP